MRIRREASCIAVAACAISIGAAFTAIDYSAMRVSGSLGVSPLSDRMRERHADRRRFKLQLALRLAARLQRGALAGPRRSCERRSSLNGMFG